MDGRILHAFWPPLAKLLYLLADVSNCCFLDHGINFCAPYTVAFTVHVYQLPDSSAPMFTLWHHPNVCKSKLA